ncbi:MAG: amino acid ABC transporter substrate-binding protein [Microbacteriaceae bacterium]|nr:amino acid ABC transporter substrate-binding protein [Microbacteriaceae bacterium]
MTKRKRNLLGLGAMAAAAALLLTGCAAGGDGGAAAGPAEDCTPAHENLPTMADGVLKVGISDMPPLVMPSGPDGYEGLDADIINGFAEAECLTVEPVNVGATAAVTSVQQGRVDVSLGGWYRTEARNQEVTMGHPLYLDGLIAAAPQEYSTFDELEGLNVGVVQGYIFVADLEARFPGQVKTYPEPTLLAEDLKNGRVDVAFDVASAALMYDGMEISSLEPDERVEASVLPAQTSFPFQKGKDELVAAFDAYVQGLHEDGGMVELLEKWELDPSLADVGEPRFS